MRVFARRERPHPGAQLTLFEAGDGWLLAWLRLLALVGALARAEPKTVLPHPARRRLADPQRPPAPPEVPGILALGR